tara:strand:+ start:436 stop:1494 length:1059 start_codon:yes stop_codon:yes gene_type:complete
MKTKERIAILGAGIFGCTLSLVLSRKFDVTIFEKRKDIMNEASKMNQFRFHLGYHYPRSQKTIKEIQKDYRSFFKFYGSDVYGITQNYYFLAKNNNKTPFEKYLNILKKNKLEFKVIKNRKIIGRFVQGAIITKEKVLNYFKLKKKIIKMIREKKIKIIFGENFNKRNLNNYKYVFITTYRDNNLVLSNLGIPPKRKFRYELVEKIVVKLPKKYEKVSCVVLDGKFLCIDPYLGTNFHLLSHVKYSKIKILRAKYYKFFNENKRMLKKEVIKNLDKSNFKKIVEHGSNYLPFLKAAKYIKSFYLIRVLNLKSMRNDDRTNQITRVNKKIFTILSGKWNTAASLSQKILREIK